MNAKQDKMKLYGAIGALLVACILLAGYFTNWFRGNAPPPLPAPPPEVQKEIEEGTKVMQQEQERLDNDAGVTRSGK